MPNITHKKLLIFAGKVSHYSPLHGLLLAFQHAGLQCRVICNTWEGKTNEEVEIASTEKGHTTNARWAKFGIILIGRDYIAYNHEREVKRLLANEKKHVDIVLSYVHMGDFSPIQLGYWYANKSKKPYWIHTVDPLPSVKGWGEKPIFRRAVKRSLQRYFDRADVCSANNEAMLQYQVERMDFKGETFCLYTPFVGTAASLEQDASKPTDKTVLLYAGSFYGKRRPEPLLEAFLHYTSKNDKVELWIAGRNNIDINSYGANPGAKRIKLLGFVSNIEELYQKSDILIDIDANIPGDVFISGKLVEYLQKDKIILSITPKGSPTEAWLSEVPVSTVIANYDPIVISRAISRAVDIANDIEIYKIHADRERMRTRFKPRTVADQLNKSLFTILSK